MRSMQRIRSQRRCFRIFRRFARILFVALIMTCVFSLHATSLPVIWYPLKESPDVGPYQDAEFLEYANETIYGLSNRTIPNGTALLELQSLQQKLATMNISPALHQKAELINAYLYYTAKAGLSYTEVLNIYNKPYSPVYRDESLMSEARDFQVASQVIWKQIADMYPGVIPYNLDTPSLPFSTNEDPNFDWPPHSPFS